MHPIKFDFVGARFFLIYLSLFLLGMGAAFGAPTPTGASAHNDIPLGATRDEVIERLGQPLSHAGFGSREIFTYPNKVRVVLEDGRVASAENLLLSIPTATPAPTESPVESDTPVTTPVPVVPPPAAPSLAVTAVASPSPTTNASPGPHPSKKSLPSSLATPKPTLPSAADEAAELGVPAGPDLNAISGVAAKMAGQITPTPGLAPKTMSAALASQFHARSLFDSSELPLPGKAMLLVFHFAITLVALYFAFRIWDMDTLTAGILAIGAIDVVLHGVFQALGPYTSGLSTMSAVENGIPAVVMIFTVRHFSFTKNIPMSVKIAAGVKTAVFLVKLVATAAMLDFVFPAQ